MMKQTANSITQIFFLKKLALKNKNRTDTIQETQNLANKKLSTWTSSTVSSAQKNDKGEETGVKGDDFYHCSRPLFILGKFCGLVPIKGLVSGELKNVTFRWTSLWTIWSIFICLGISFVATVGFIEFAFDLFGTSYGSGRTHHLILLSRGPLILVQGAFMYTVLISKAPAIVKLFQKWRNASTGLDFSVNHQKVRKRVTILTYVIVIPAVIHINLVLSSGFGIWNTRTNEVESYNGTNLERFFARFWPSWTQISPSHSVIIPTLIFLLNLTHFSWLFADVLIIIMSILLYGKFKAVYDMTVSELNRVRKEKTLIDKGRNLWVEVRRDHMTCTYLLWETDEILSPFIFVSYATSIYFICIQIHKGITPASNHGSYEESALAILTLFFITSRMMFMTITAAKLNDCAREFNACIQKCPNKLYSVELKRLERMLSSTNHSIGLSGLGCFVVTRAFLLVIASVIFTFEIILLQTLNPESNMNFSACNNTKVP